MLSADEILGGIISAVEDVAERKPYYRLVLVAGNDDEALSVLLSAASGFLKTRHLNVSLELSQRLLNVPSRLRATRLARTMDDLLWEAGDVVVLDRIELLFEPTLEARPLKLLQALSRNRTVLAAWPGVAEDDLLFHAEPGHAEYGHASAEGVALLTIA